MISNPFLDPTQSNSIGPSAAPNPDQMAFRQAMMQRAQEDAVKFQLQQQGLAGRQQMGGQAIGTAGRVLGTTISGSSLSAVVPVAGMATSIYGGNENAGESIHALNSALGSGVLTPEEEAAARQKVFDQGMTKLMIGGSLGAVGGGIPGALAGSFGGLKQGYGAYDSPSQGFQAFTNWARNPFKR